MTAPASAAQLRVLDLAADGKLQYSTRFGSWEPDEGDRRQPFDVCEQRGWIAIDYDADPVGRVTKRVPVELTPAGQTVRATAGRGSS
jgi:hypothetical protein